jgi:hypothetical protein
MQPQSPSDNTPAMQSGSLPPANGALPAIPEVPPAAQSTPPAPNGGAKQAADVSAPAMADDGDLIEKEWVHKVKQVVHATAHDPYEQNRQFTKLKADYMQKRYGKSIKLDE